MENLTSNPGYAREQATCREPHWGMLHHLKKNGPLSWKALSLYFGPDRTEEFIWGLQDLTESQSVIIGPTSIVEITALGAEQIKVKG